MPNDILLGLDFDLAFEGGDLVIDEATTQHQQLLLLTHYGEWRESPMVGIGINLFLQDELSEDLMSSAIKQGFEGDGMVVSVVRARKNIIQTDARYP